MHWYLIHTKPRQENSALLNLTRQGYECYLPMLQIEKLRRTKLVVIDEPLFPRYLFIRLGHGGAAQSWSPIRSTKGVARLVSFGVSPAKVDDALVDFLQLQDAACNSPPQPLFTPGERVCLTEGAFSGFEGLYQMTDGDARVIVLIELMSKPVAIRVAPASVRKVN